eukprot:tig00001065_g6711.t1
MGDEGSFFYLAPEVIRDEPADEKVDVYSLGMLLYEAATGRRPFEGSGLAPMAASLAAATEGLRPALPEEGPAAALAPVIRACWAHEPDARPSAADAFRLLDELARPRLPLPLSPGTPAAPLLPPQRPPPLLH